MDRRPPREAENIGGGKIWLEEIIWGGKTFGGGKNLGEEDIWVRKYLIGQPACLGGRRGKTFGGGKHLGRKYLVGGIIWGRKTFGGPEASREAENIWGRKNLGEERFNWTALPRRPRRPEGENIWGRKDLVGGNHMGEEMIWGRKKFGGGRHLGEERFNWTRRGKTFGGGKHLGEEDIWVRKDLIG